MPDAPFDAFCPPTTEATLIDPQISDRSPIRLLGFADLATVRLRGSGGRNGNPGDFRMKWSNRRPAEDLSRHEEQEVHEQRTSSVVAAL